MAVCARCGHDLDQLVEAAALAEREYSSAMTDHALSQRQQRIIAAILACRLEKNDAMARTWNEALDVAARIVFDHLVDDEKKGRWK
jgi:hypothetical protein